MQRTIVPVYMGLRLFLKRVHRARQLLATSDLERMIRLNDLRREVTIHESMCAVEWC